MKGNGFRWRIRYAVGRIELAPIDAALVVLSMVLALWIRHDSWSFSDAVTGVVSFRPGSTAAIAVMYALLFTAFRLYRYDLRYSGLQTSRSVVVAILCGIPFVVGIQRLLDGSPFPRSVLGIFLVFSILLVGGLRVLLRLIADQAANRAAGRDESTKPAKRTLIVGSSDQGAQLARAIREDSSLQHYSIMGLLDDAPNKTGIYYGSVPVLGATDLLYDYLERGPWMR